MDNILVTTTVSLDADVGVPQKVIHLTMGDYGTRRLRLVPVSGGHLLDVSSAEQAKVRLQSGIQEALLINCVKGDTYADLIPTPAMVAEADEWQTQLVLLDENNQTLHSAPFTIIVHGTVYTGDAVEHANSAVTAAYYDENGRLAIELESGKTVKTTDFWHHGHDAATAESAGFMSAQDKADVETIKGYVDQNVKQAGSPTFAGLTVGALTIDGEGNITGARFG